MSPQINVLWLSPQSPGPQEDALLGGLGGFRVVVAKDVPAALELAATSTFTAAVASFPASGATPEEFLERLRRIDPAIAVLVRDAGGGFEDAVRLTRLGACHYVGPQVSPTELAGRLELAAEDRRSRELALLNARLADEPWRKWLVGESRAIQKIAQIIRLVGARRSTVLITGETGTGKEMVARALHAASPRAHRPMVTVNCSALPENLLEAELFGHVRGAFTGAVSQRVGRFEQASESTLFLDEIGEMPVDLQAKLLRVLQEREFQRLGSSETIRVDVRLVAASNANLVEKIGRGQFREDLYYRLNVVPIQIPPLRERLEDVPLLVNHFLEKICRQEGLPARRVHPEALERLRSYSWPGNVRQLENAVEMAVALSGDRATLFPGDFPLPLPACGGLKAASVAPPVCLPEEGMDFEETVSRFERGILEEALRRSGGSKKKAADLLRLKRTTLSAKLRTLEARASG